MKVLLHFEDCLEDELRMTVKLTLPKKWVSGPIQRLLDTFVEAYNNKHPENVLDASVVHFEDKDRKQAPFDAPVNQVMESGDDLYLKQGPSSSMSSLGFVEVQKKEEEVKSFSATAARQAADANTNFTPACSTSPNTISADSKGDLLCKRFGCNKKYFAGDKEECRHHTKPPVFHETRKFWACCPDKIAWDWESFTAIPGCSVGEHTNVKQDGQQFLGGVEMRLKDDESSTPQRIAKSGLDKLSILRKGLAAVGVMPQLFDATRDKLKDKHANEGDKVWDFVADDLGGLLSTCLQDI